MIPQDILNACRDRDDYPEVFKDSDGADVVLDGYTTRARWIEKNRPREIELTITSYIGTCWEAIHFYGNLRIEGIDFSSANNLDCFTSDNNTRQIEKANPLAKGSYSIELIRELTQEEIDKDPSRWEWLHAGSYTNGFNSKEEIIELAKEVIKYRFVGNWELKITDNS